MTRLTTVEEEIMQFFWMHGPSTISSLIERMPNPKSPHSTISSIARILEKKGFLHHKTYGRTYEYYPAIEKHAYQKFSLIKLASNYFDGSVENLVSFLVKEEKIDKGALIKLIDQLENKKS